LRFLNRILLLVLLAGSCACAQTGTTYAEKLGWKKDDGVLILHIPERQGLRRDHMERGRRTPQAAAVEERPTIGNIFVAGLLPRLGRWDSLLSETAPFVVLWLFLYWMYRTRSFFKI